MTPDERTLTRWRLVLGTPGATCAGLSSVDAARDASLDWLYGADPDRDRRGVRRTGGREEATVDAVTWLDGITTLFPRETVERLQRDAIERYEIVDILNDPSALDRAEPSPALLKAVLRTKHLMNPDVLAAARRIVERVVAELVERLRPEVRASFHGARARGRSATGRAADFDWRATIERNLKHFDPDTGRLPIRRPVFTPRVTRHLDSWQVILLVDQSGSMVGSVIHSAVTAACLWSIPGVRPHLVAFDTAVVDLTDDVTDPVELLMRVQLGGGTDIARAVSYAGALVAEPRRAIVVLISDLYEGGSTYALLATVRELLAQGTVVLVLPALDTEAAPVFDRDLAHRLVDLGAHVGAMTPAHLALFVADCLAGRPGGNR